MKLSGAYLWEKNPKRANLQKSWFQDLSPQPAPIDHHGPPVWCARSSKPAALPARRLD
jgi:hypothetical protein